MCYFGIMFHRNWHFQVMSNSLLQHYQSRGGGGDHFKLYLIQNPELYNLKPIGKSRKALYLIIVLIPFVSIKILQDGKYCNQNSTKTIMVLTLRTFNLIKEI